MPIYLKHHLTELESDQETPVSLFMRLVGDNPGILLESVDVDGRWGRYSIIATHFVCTIACRQGRVVFNAVDEALKDLHVYNGQDYIEGLRQIMQELVFDGEKPDLPAITRGLYGYLGYGVASLLEKKLAAALPVSEAEACLVLPGTVIIFDHMYNRITRLDLTIQGRAVLPVPHTMHQHEPIRPQGALHTQSGFIDAVNRMKEQIRQGEVIQAVLSVPFQAPFTANPFTFYRRLRRRNPSPYMFYMNLPDGAVLGSSPELLIRCEESQLRLSPIAGTRPRGKVVEEDVLFGDELLHDPKERAEHTMLVDLGRNDLGRIAKAGSVKVERFMEVERFSHVMHLTSRIEAELDPVNDAFDILRAAFPAGTVSGAPKLRAIELVAEEEQLPRGPYAGAIGWLGLDKDSVNLDFGITIRSLWIRESVAHWQAGAGIVFDSQPEMEWAECLRKAAIIKEVLEETMAMSGQPTAGR
jgi:anthranilate synthase component 1